MKTYMKQHTERGTGNATDTHKREWLVREMPQTFDYPYYGWNADGTDKCEAATLADALTAFGLTAK